MSLAAILGMRLQSSETLCNGILSDLLVEFAPSIFLRCLPFFSTSCFPASYLVASFCYCQHFPQFCLLDGSGSGRFSFDKSSFIVKNVRHRWADETAVLFFESLAVVKGSLHEQRF